MHINYDSIRVMAKKRQKSKFTAALRRKNRDKKSGKGTGETYTI